MSELEALLHKQHGAITTTQALATGLTRHAIEHRLNSGRWLRAHRGVYLTIAAAGHRTAQLSAALLYAGLGATLRGWTAAELHGLRNTCSAQVEIWVPAARSVAVVPGLRVRRTSCLPDIDRRAVGGLAVTSIERTLIDLCTALPGERQRIALVAEVLQAGRTSPHRLRMCLRRQATARGAGRLQQVLTTLQPGFESGLEEQLGRHLAGAGLHPICQHKMTLADGRRIRLDFAFPAEQVNVEADGAAFHLSPSQRDADLLRDEALRRMGWEVVRASTAQVRGDPAAVVRRVRAALEARRLSA